MNPFSLLRLEIVRRPIFNGLIVLIAAFWGNLWLAVIVLTLIIRFMMMWSTKAGWEMQKQMTNLQPKMTEIQERYKDDPTKQSEEVMKLFKTEGAWPLKGCLTTLVQIPVFIGLLFTVQEFAKGEVANGMIYSFLTSINVQIAQVNPWFLWMNLLDHQNIILTILAAILMYAQMTMMQWVQPKPTVPATLTGWQAAPDMSSMMKYMNYFFVFAMWSFVWSMPGAIGLYIITTTLFGVIQQYFQYRELVDYKLKTMFRK